jgi:hypothetical protein
MRHGYLGKGASVPKAQYLFGDINVDVVGKAGKFKTLPGESCIHV